MKPERCIMKFIVSIPFDPLLKVDSVELIAVIGFQHILFRTRQQLCLLCKYLQRIQIKYSPSFIPELYVIITTSIIPMVTRFRLVYYFAWNHLTHSRETKLTLSRPLVWIIRHVWRWYLTTRNLSNVIETNQVCFYCHAPMRKANVNV